MNQEQENRLEEVEAALDRQVAVNADLRTSIEILKISIDKMQNSMEFLLKVANQHQENFMVLVREIREIREDMRETQVQNRRIVDQLELLSNYLEKNVLKNI